MEELNLPDSLYEDYSKLTLTSSSSEASSSTAPPPNTMPPPSQATIFWWIIELQNPSNSDFALKNLANHRNDFEILPVLLWNSPGTVAMLLQEIVRSYGHIIGHIALPYFAPFRPIRVYNILLLFQCIADHPETKIKFLRAKMPHYFYPLMDIDRTDKRFECLRLGAMGVIAHLLKGPVDAASIRFLMDTGAFGFCTKPVEIGSIEAKKLAVFILHKILSTDVGLQYCCVLAERFLIIDDLLKKLLVYISTMTRPSSTLFNLVVSCYIKLSEKSRARNMINRYTPVLLFNGTFAKLLDEDPVSGNYVKQLIENLENTAANMV